MENPYLKVFHERIHVTVRNMLRDLLYINPPIYDRRKDIMDDALVRVMHVMDKATCL